MGQRFRDARLGGLRYGTLTRLRRDHTGLAYGFMV